MKVQVSGGPASRLTRWALKLYEYNFDAEHKPGANHSDADALSRLVAAIASSPTAASRESLAGSLSVAAVRQVTSTARRLQATDRAKIRHATSRSSVIDSYLDVGIPSGDAFRRDLDADLFARDVMDHLLVNLQPDLPGLALQISELAQRYQLQNGVLYRKTDVTSDDPSTFRLYVPEALRHSYTVAVQDHAGHLGVEQMCRLLRSCVNWPQMAADVASYVHECHECTLAKPPMRTLASLPVRVWVRIPSTSFTATFCGWRLLMTTSKARQDMIR
jgi:hypothetical protein